MTEHTTCPDCKATDQLDQFCRFCQQHFGPNTNRWYWSQHGTPGEHMDTHKTANPQTAPEAALQLVAETRFLLRLLESKQPDGLDSIGLEGQKRMVSALCDCYMRRATGKLVDKLALAKSINPTHCPGA